MNTYLITYDLNTPGQKYHCIYNKIDENYSSWNCMNNIFIIESPTNSESIYKLLKPCIDDNDKLLIIKLEKGINADGYSSGMDKECDEWLRNALT